MNRITMEWINEQIQREKERGNTPAAITDLASLITVRKHLMEESTEEHHHSHHHHNGLTKEQAVDWVHSMEAADKNCKSGGKWSWEEAQRVAKERGINPEGQMMVDFYAALNMVYSDYCKVARDHGVANEEFFTDMAMAFLFDRDAIEPTDKICMYHKYLVAHKNEDF